MGKQVFGEWPQKSTDSKDYKITFGVDLAEVDSKDVTAVTCCKLFKDGTIEVMSIKKAHSTSAFNAMLAYELNCREKYDYPDYMKKPSKTPRIGDRMEDFAYRYRTTIKEMKLCEREVDQILGPHQ